MVTFGKIFGGNTSSRLVRLLDVWVMLFGIMMIGVLNLRRDGESAFIEISSVQHERRVGCGMLFEGDDRGPLFTLVIFEFDGIDLSTETEKVMELGFGSRRREPGDL